MPNLSKPMPRELADGVFWLGDCLEQRAKGKIYHTYNAAFLLCGTNASMLIETGHPKDFPIIEKQLRDLLATRAPLNYLFVTHQETPHSGGLGRVLARYPEAILCGDMSDYHLAFPQFADRMLPMMLGDEIDLGDRSFTAVEPVIRDLRTTWWVSTARNACCFRATALPTASTTRTATAACWPRKRSRSISLTSRRCSPTGRCSGPSSPT
jgi:hypothetical protein